MSNKSKLKPVAAVLGTTFVVSMAASPVANAADNPFQMNELSSGYMIADSHEGKCGDKGEEGKCGDKGEEGKCGEGKCGDKKESEGKCGEGKCGA
ncbi:MAG TPA: hypothetical protein VLN56_07565 [Gammaproteobacteria bacterium]|nr:hypothetical protein [Gammaproteobacteria bacterium]